MKLFHENPIFWNSEIESDNFTVWNSEIISFDFTEKYNSLKSIKEDHFFACSLKDNNIVLTSNRTALMS